MVAEPVFMERGLTAPEALTDQRIQMRAETAEAAAEAPVEVLVKPLSLVLLEA